MARARGGARGHPGPQRKPRREPPPRPRAVPLRVQGGPTRSHWRPPSLSDSLFFRLKLPSCLTAPLGACRADTVGHRHIMMRLHGVHATPSPGGPCVLRARRPCRLLGLCARAPRPLAPAPSRARAPRPLAPARHAPASHAVSRALLSLTALLFPPARERRSVPPPPLLPLLQPCSLARAPQFPRPPPAPPASRASLPASAVLLPLPSPLFLTLPPFICVLLYVPRNLEARSAAHTSM